MRLKNLLFFTSFIFFIVGCSNDSVEPVDENESTENEEPIDEISEEPFSGPYFTLNVENNFNTSTSDEWVVIQDSHGKLLEFRPFEDGDSLVFESMTPEEITAEIIITLFEFKTFGQGNKNYSITTYAEIPRGSIWNLKSLQGFNSDRGELLTNATTIIENLPGTGFRGFSVSTKNGGLGGGAGFLNNTFQADFNLWENDERHLFSIVDTNNDKRFNFVDDFPTDGLLTLDYNNFSDFDEKIEIGPPTLDVDYSVHVQAFEENQEFGINEGYSILLISRQRTQNAPPELVYLDEFNEYITSFDAFMENYEYNFRQVGGKTANIDIPENASLTVENETVANFSFTTNTSFIRRESFWQSRIGQFNNSLEITSWKIESSKNISVPVALPAEILQEYPELNIEELEYSYTRLFTDFDSYEERLEKKFISTSPIYGVGFSEESLIFNKE